MTKAMYKFAPAVAVAAILFAGSIQTATAEPINVGNDTVEFVEVAYDFPNSGESTWFYTVESGKKPAISHVVFEAKLDCLEIVEEGTWDKDGLNKGEGNAEIGIDKKKGLTGVKFDLGFDDNEGRNYYITVNGNYSKDQITFASKGGNGYDSVKVTGPSLECETSDTDDPNPDVTSDIGPCSEETPCRTLARTDAKCDWYMIAPSCNTGDTGVYELYSDDHSGKYCEDSPNDNRTAYPKAHWRIWADEDDITNPKVDLPFPLRPDDPVKLGEGYWMCMTRPACIDVTCAEPTPTFDCGEYGGEEGKQCAAVDVKKTNDNLDMIGHPFSKPVLWNSVKVACNTKKSKWRTLSPEEANKKKILSKNYFTYNANAYATHGPGHKLDPQTGYWVKTKRKFDKKCPGGVKLLIPAPE